MPNVPDWTALDEFAARAMQSIIPDYLNDEYHFGHTNGSDVDSAAMAAYAMAAAMAQERIKRRNRPTSDSVAATKLRTHTEAERGSAVAKNASEDTSHLLAYLRAIAEWYRSLPEHCEARKHHGVTICGGIHGQDDMPQELFEPLLALQ